MSADASIYLLAECVKRCDQVSIVECAGTWAITEGDGNQEGVCEAEGESLEIAIRKFAERILV